MAELHILLFVCLTLALVFRTASTSETSFLFNGFASTPTNLTLTNNAKITQSGALLLTNDSVLGKGYAFYPNPLHLKTSSISPNASSFSTEFVFAIVTDPASQAGQGLTFFLAPSPKFPNASAALYLGLFDKQSDGNSSNHIFAVEFDTSPQPEVTKDIDGNHVGIDVNSIVSSSAVTAAYFDDSGMKIPLNLSSGKSLHAWIEYSDQERLINVTIAPLNKLGGKPKKPLISYNLDLSTVLIESMYAGFSASTGFQGRSDHYVLAWSFAVSGASQPVNVVNLPWFPSPKTVSRLQRLLPQIIPYSSTLGILLLLAIGGICYVVYKRRKLAEEVESWELDYPHRFSFRSLYKATGGFKDANFIGRGGFGAVYKGVLRGSGEAVAVKKVIHGANQGIKEFVAEVSSLGMLRHRNLVHLHGWCRRRGELLLVYDFMPNGSLDSFLFGDDCEPLSWDERFKILRGIAAGLLYLHEEWEQTVIHRDVKASNVLLDADFNGRLSDFGLARLHDHGEDPQTTHIVGTLGYMGPEISRTGKATTSSDVFSYGALLLEVACGRRPIEPKRAPEEVVLVDWVVLCWKKGWLLDVIDPKLGGGFDEKQAELVVKLGLLCSQSRPEARPSIRQVTQFLDGDASLDEFGVDNLQNDDGMGFDHIMLMYPSSEGLSSTSDSYIGSNLAR